MKYDNLLKEIFRDAMPALLRLLGLPKAVKYLNVELPRRNRVVPDLLVELDDQRILHLDMQAQNQADFPWRCLDYYSAIKQVFRPRPSVVQVLIYVGSEPLSVRGGITDEYLTFRYRILDLSKVPARTFLDSPSDLERMLAVLCQSSDPKTTIRRILGSWKHLPKRRLQELLLRLATLSQLRKYDTIAREEIERMPIHLDITENAFYKAALEKGEARGEARGEAKALLRILVKRFGKKVSATVRKRVLSASVDELDRWLDRSISASSLDDVFSA